MKHTCHWEGCEKSCPPAMWGCKEHWFKLPKYLRDAVWKEYRPGQEITKTPSAKYVAVALIVKLWIKVYSEKGIAMSERQLLDLAYALNHPEESKSP